MQFILFVDATKDLSSNVSLVQIELKFFVENQAFCLKGKLSSPFNTREYLVSNIGDLFGIQPTISLNKKDRMYIQMKLFVVISYRFSQKST